MPASAPHAPPLLSPEAMRAADAFAIDDFGVPSRVLMEAAGRASADHVAATYGPLEEQTVAVFCGKGNNGGDGLVAARRLLALGAGRVRVVLAAGTEDLSDDAAPNLRLLERWNDETGGGRLSLVAFDTLAQLGAQTPADVHVDALLGTGLTSELREPIRSLVGWINEQPAPVVALDGPTGLHAGTGAVLGRAVHADQTVTMAARKTGLTLGEGPIRAGRVEVAEIGIPAFALRRPADEGRPGCARLTTDAAVASWLPERAHDAYKYSVGLALVVGGAPGMTGAPVMSASAAARAGAGYVQCACPAGAQHTLNAKLTAITTTALPVESDDDDEGDGLKPRAALDALGGALDKAGGLLVGPGLGRADGTQRFVRRLLEKTGGGPDETPVVIDADGLNALADRPDDWFAQHSRGRWVLTPHVGEFKRLAGTGDVDLSDRLRTAQDYARRWQCVLVLKGMPSVVSGPAGRAYVCGAGNPALATAGTGDVLAGLTAGLLAQGTPPLESAAAALHLGGAAADRYVARRAARSLTAPDLVGELPPLLHERFA
ncbi:MAG: bifunctional ADP-dependent NAD(P)H-hydrate dehydratase/NAD(P)H-hydrate epimerase [Bacteroidetes bacterium QS_8_68_15]|nr:MAG: bifunctional ADP-dependent NAD(P)H-hydrate dehydratase/NAD(P)H-hydrate epimerase [Bacteroidetes bacterium QS_8_68_15]